MGFKIIKGSPVHSIWVPVDNNDRTTYETLRVGQLVRAGSDGVINLGSATGVNDTTSEYQPYGLVIGTNLKTPSYDSTYHCNNITAVDPHSTATEFVGVEGINAPKGDKSAYVEVALITPETILSGQFFNASFGTAITVGTVTTGSTTGAGFTCSGGLSDASTPVADLGTVYCRKGANAGIYRITTDTSATVKTVGHYFQSDIAVGDTFVNVQCRSFGKSYVQTDAEAMFFNAAANPATDHWLIDVLALDLSTAGSEHVIFRFNSVHFAPTRS